MKILQHIFTILIKDSALSLANPRRYFSGMKKEGGSADAVIKTSFYGIIAALLNQSKALEIYNASIFKIFFPAQDFVLLLSFIAAIITTFLYFFIGAFFLLIISKICGGITRYTLCLKISASFLVLLPVNVLINYPDDYLLKPILSLLLLLYGAWMFYNAMTKTLEGNSKTIKIFLTASAVCFIALIAVLYFLMPQKPAEDDKAKMKIQDFLKIYEKSKIEKDNKNMPRQ